MCGWVCARMCTCVCGSCSVMSNSQQPHGLQLSRFLSPCNSPGQNTGVGCHSLFQGIFPTQGLNLGLLYCRQILYHLKPSGKPILKCTFLYFSNTPHLFLSHRLSVQYYLTKKSPFSRLPHYPLLTLLTGITSVSHFMCCCLHRSKSDIHQFALCLHSILL